MIFSTATYVRDAGVAGSNPAAPTILKNSSDCWWRASQPDKVDKRSASNAREDAFACPWSSSFECCLRTPAEGIGNKHPLPSSAAHVERIPSKCRDLVAKHHQSEKNITGTRTKLAASGGWATASSTHARPAAISTPPHLTCARLRVPTRATQSTASIDARRRRRAARSRWARR